MKAKILLSVMMSAILLGCVPNKTSHSLKVKISDDGKTFYWKIKGVTIDPLEKKMIWHMENKQWDNNGRPLQSVGKSTFTIDSKEYQVTADFTFDSEGYKQIKLTVTGGDLIEPLSAEAERP